MLTLIGLAVLFPVIAVISLSAMAGDEFALMFFKVPLMILGSFVGLLALRLLFQVKASPDGDDRDDPAARPKLVTDPLSGMQRWCPPDPLWRYFRPFGTTRSEFAARRKLGDSEAASDAHILCLLRQDMMANVSGRLRAAGCWDDSMAVPLPPGLNRTGTARTPAPSSRRPLPTSPAPKPAACSPCLKPPASGRGPTRS